MYNSVNPWSLTFVLLFLSFHIHHTLISEKLHVLKFRSDNFEIHVEQVSTLAIKL